MKKILAILLVMMPLLCKAQSAQTKYAAAIAPAEKTITIQRTSLGDSKMGDKNYDIEVQKISVEGTPAARYFVTIERPLWSNDHFAVQIELADVKKFVAFYDKVQGELAAAEDKDDVTMEYHLNTADGIVIAVTKEDTKLYNLSIPTEILTCNNSKLYDLLKAAIGKCE